MQTRGRQRNTFYIVQYLTVTLDPGMTAMAAAAAAAVALSDLELLP